MRIEVANQDDDVPDQIEPENQPPGGHEGQIMTQLLNHPAVVTLSAIDSLNSSQMKMKWSAEAR